MNILIISPWYKPNIGGVVNTIDKIIKSLIKKNNIYVLIEGSSHRIKKNNEDNGVPVYSFYKRSFSSSDHPLKAFIAFILYFVPTVLRLRRFLREHRIDLTVINYPGANDIYFVFLKILFGEKYIVHVHGSDINLLAEQNRFVISSVRMIIRNSSALVACSRKLLNNTREIIKSLPARTAVIYPGINTEFAELESENKYDLPPNYILTLAWANEVKGPDIIIDAFSIIAEKFPEVHLVMVGGGPREEELAKQIENLSIQNQVIRLGTLNKEDLPNIYRNCLFGVIPSRNEGFGQVSLEFQLFKKALIATNVGGLSESIRTNFNGLIIPPNDSKILAEKMKYLLENPDECRIMGENGYKNVLENFNHEKTVMELSKLFHDTASK